MRGDGETEFTHVYFHGQPGGARELELFAGCRSWTCELIIADRTFAGQNFSNTAEYLTALADQINAATGSKPLHLIGFSIGACIALRIYPLLSDRVKAISLISAACPIRHSADFQTMAGGPVFESARNDNLKFAALIVAQSIAARIAPGYLMKALFSSATRADQKLAADPVFRDTMKAILRTGLGHHAVSYKRDLIAYVEDWAEILPQIKAPVSLLHGKEDNWAPSHMAETLSADLPDCQRLTILEGQSHYSTLREFWSQY